MKKNIYFFEIEDVLTNQAKLPYRTGLIWSYCLEHEKIKDNFNLDGWYWYRDKNNTVEKIFKKINNPKLVAFSCFVWNWNWNMQMAKKIKKKWPKCIILIGGWQPPISDRSQGFFKEYKFIDLICHGEGEIAVKEILFEILKTKKDWKSIKGCSMPFRMLGKDKKIKNNVIDHNFKKIDEEYISRPSKYDTYVSDPRPRIDHLAQMPSPYLNGLFDKIIKNCPYDLEGTIETTRGCPFGCTFCEIGTKYYQKIKTPTIEKVFREIDWLSNNKVVFVYNADSNFGMLPSHLDIASYLIKKKSETGYPEKHRVDWAKIHGDRVIKLAKMFYDAKMDKGITIALQSMNPKTLEAVKRKNMDDGKLAEFLKKYNESDLPSYMELILGLPEETTESFVDGVCKIMELGQHNYIGIYPLTALPNTPFGDPKYIKRYGLKIINTFPAFAHVDISEQNNFEREKMVVSNRLMSINDYKETTLWRWLFMFSHYLGYTQYLSRFLKSNIGLSYKDFYLNLMSFVKNPKKSKFLNKEYQETSKAINKVLKCKGPWGRAVDKIRNNFAWDFEEATAINIILNRKEFNKDIYNFMKSFGIKKELLDDLIKFQDNATVDPTKSYPYTIETKFNFNEVIKFSSKLKQEKSEILIQGKNYHNDIFEWGKETLWWGRRVAANKVKLETHKSKKINFDLKNFQPVIFDKR
jgi:putative methyltransferase